MRLLYAIALAVSGLAFQHIRGTLQPLHAPSSSAAPGLQVRLRTREARTTFHLNESIPLEVYISSAIPQRYSIELDYGWNNVAGDVEFILSPGHGTVQPPGHAIGSYACCNSRRVFLTSVPEVFRFYLTRWVRFSDPGTYHLQFRTNEVFKGDGTRKDMYRTRGDVPAVSNVITLTILPDDPLWDAETLQQAIRTLDDPRAATILAQDDIRVANAFGPKLPGKRTPRLPGPLATRYFDAQQALETLDTVEAIRERVRRTRVPSESEWRDQPLVADAKEVDDSWVWLSTRHDLIVAALEERASEDEFGVWPGYALSWIQEMRVRDVPEVTRLRGDPPASQRSIEAAVHAHSVVLASLRRLVESKTGVARAMTLHTIHVLEGTRN